MGYNRVGFRQTRIHYKPQKKIYNYSPKKSKLPVFSNCPQMSTATTLTPSLPLPATTSPSKPSTPLWVPSPTLLSQHPILRHLHSCTSMDHLRQLHAHTITSGAAADNFVSSRILAFSALSPSGSLPYALRLFSQIPNPDPFIANILIRAYASSPNPSRALKFYAQMLQSLSLRRPDAHTFPLLLKACAEVGSVQLGLMLHAQAVKLGLGFDVSVQNFLVRMYAACGLIGAARVVFDGIEEYDDASRNVMLNGMLKCGCFEEALKMFDGMSERDVVSWSVMINGYVKDSRFKEGLLMFRRMLAVGVEPNESVYVNVLSACAYLGAVEQGRWVERYLRKKRVRMTVRIGTALVDMYLKCGCVERAFEIFDLMGEKNVMAWSAMVGGLAINGRGEEAMQLFRKMEEDGVLPNEVTFVGVLNACSHCGLVDAGSDYFNSMTSAYGLKPNVQHYCCLVDLYGRAGLLDRAEEVIKEMPMKPNSAVWGALLNSCRIHGNTLLGEHVGKKLLELEPNNSGRYVLLSNIYAANGKWEEVAELRRMMKKIGVNKTPGSSFIDLKGTVHEFIAGDNFHPQKGEIYGMLDKMMKELKLAGYKPSTDQLLLDMDEEEKETALGHHSEKLALAFGLIKSGPGTTIRITKNLRVCADCHSATKLISKIYNREIIVRDRSRFHHFSEGACSCQDFW